MVNMERRRIVMNMERRRIVVIIGGMCMGMVVYLRLWSIDNSISSNDTELLRNQFDLASREAMDESADWRRRYDHEFEKASKCFTVLNEMKKSHGGTAQAQNMEMLQKENMDLLERVNTLKQELEAEKLNCSTPKL